jgi:hypothetical protein
MAHTKFCYQTRYCLWKKASSTHRVYMTHKHSIQFSWPCGYDLDTETTNGDRLYTCDMLTKDHNLYGTNIKLSLLSQKATLQLMVLTKGIEQDLL